MPDDLPTAPETSRKAALTAGARLLELQLRQSRARAMHQDGNPFGAQYKVEPAKGGHEALMLEVLHLAQCCTILREMARAED